MRTDRGGYMALSEELLAILACPACKGALAADGEQALICGACRLRFPVRDGIAVLLVEEAEQIS
jgi:uncharacterized protein